MYVRTYAPMYLHTYAHTCTYAQTYIHVPTQIQTSNTNVYPYIPKSLVEIGVTYL